MILNPRYTTLTSLRRRRFQAGSAAPTTDDTFLDACIDQASRWITRQTRNRVFVPYYQARQFRYTSVTEYVYGSVWLPEIWWTTFGKLMLDEDLLSVTTLTNGDADSTVITADQYDLMPLNNTPYEWIELTSDSGAAWEFENRSSNVTVAGLWGFHPDYANAWASIDTLQTAITTTDATTITVSNAALFEDGDYLLIDSEIMRVTATNTTPAPDQLTVLRGQNNTTAATHLISAAVKVYRFVPDIQLATERLAIWFYDNRDSVQNSIEVVDLAMKLESKIPVDVWGTVHTYRKDAAYAV